MTAAPRKSRKRPSSSPLEAIVHALGDRGDGLARPASGGERLFYVAGALPGERVRLRPQGRKGDGEIAELEAVIEASAERVDPPCPHAALCGGCDLQHLDPPALADWKRDKVVRALAHRGLGTVTVDQTLSLPAGTRRRLSVGLRGRARHGVCGFFARESHRLIDTPHCLLPTPPLAALMEHLRRALPGFLAPAAEGTALMTETETGIDLRLDLPTAPELTGREALAALAEDADLARLTLTIAGGSEEPVALRRAPKLTLGGTPVLPPPGPFLQPSVDGERALTDLVLAAFEDLPAGAVIADLFCGLGTFALPLAARGFKLRGWDIESSAIGALGATAPARAGKVQATTRDLFRRPLVAEELAGWSGVVLDPPRAGAKAQVEALAAAGPGPLGAPVRPSILGIVGGAPAAAATGPSVIVLVSCAPASFARDARALVDGGYRIDWVRPVDQFTWSHHVEVVARFSRG
ncbi:class I SAM-dependent RNA methyltransferase [Rhodospirillum rubrum]|uniref:23S rRNA (Uracil-5-)-methyltransferase RumA n=1 Tax=Rhodospirillum rubrum (strain ATCC 11170 / ATH 1.1.1 / DSM 467 / LMG 4362 / NCIMB 8255 / S1) TaxID=269796 RepID=Q2RSI8_RHORT|nr:class I SAM-dependent RNA methyltransferase [Rhodospirillum rubrum]ABC22907.1 23S rRNA (uracil-5-)-methyltransferase RumA [Rhodospirillum rubrum ATCC 11170]AEO48631.1 23S rRNA (uracil-5-)-methyltransferase RumA [Rhodospirillum rubrum F11]MBK5954512.1 class I SAM-dependent RNA methyltransferase [Rhodospirillum rubrum]QXG78894.1 class I SAM-dependent RNA methyltransferase [Rhodospirillum rubrum]